MIDLFKMSSAGLPKGTRVVGFRGSEGISRLYAFEVFLGMGPDQADALNLEDAVGAIATLTADRQDGRPPFAFHGLLSDVALVHQERDGLCVVRTVLVPRLWQLTLTLHSRIFTGMSIPDILKQVLDKAGQNYALKLAQQYPAEEHVCQYAESDFDFLSRWMEREGMYYFFEQNDDGEKLIITDGKSTHEDLAPAPIRFFAHAGGDASAKECLHSFVCRQRSLPASITLKDYDYAKPKLDVSGKAPVSTKGNGEIHIHGARFFSPDDGARLAKLRAEQILARKLVFNGSGASFYLRAGYTFTLEDHPRASFDAKYIVTEAEHYGNQDASTPELKRLTGLDVDEVYRVDVTAIPASVQFRAEARTAWPRIYGTEHGMVDGPADSEYAQLDDAGRYAVRFAFDESDLEPGKASTRVRMMQPHGGGVEGWHFPLRKGTEVLFTFLGGDPDRPVIAGVVPNATTPSPVTNGNHTTNVIQTGGRNRFELEDKKGEERITLSTPHSKTYIRMGAPNDDHTMIVKTDGPTLLHTGSDWDVTVKGKLTEDVYQDVVERYQGSQDTEITKGRKETIFGGGMTHLITGAMFQKVTGDRIQDVSGTFSHKVKGAVMEEYGSQDVTCGPGTFVYGSIHANSKGLINVSGAGLEVTAPATIFHAQAFMLDAPQVTINGGDVQMKSGAWKGISTGPTLEGFLSKNAFGAQKAEACGVALSYTSTKLDATAVSLSLGAFKGENEGLVKKSNGVCLQMIGSDIKNAATAILNAALAKIG